MDMVRVPSPFRAVAWFLALVASCLVAVYCISYAPCCFIQCPHCFLTAAEATLLRSLPPNLLRRGAPHAAAAALARLLLGRRPRRRALAFVGIATTVSVHNVFARLVGLYFVTPSADRLGSHDTVVLALAVVESVFACAVVLYSALAILRRQEFAVFRPFS